MILPRNPNPATRRASPCPHAVYTGIAVPSPDDSAPHDDAGMHRVPVTARAQWPSLERPAAQHLSASTATCLLRTGRRALEVPRSDGWGVGPAESVRQNGGESRRVVAVRIRRPPVSQAGGCVQPLRLFSETPT